MGHALFAPLREPTRWATAYAGPSCAALSEPVSAQPFSVPGTATEARVDLIDQSTRQDGNGFPVLPSSTGSPSGRRAYRPAGPVPVGTTKER